jgi:hypothetical protein
MQLICTQDATASSFQDRQDRLAAHDLAPIKQFWDDYKFGKLQFLKAATPVFYSLWKARQLWRKQSILPATVFWRCGHNGGTSCRRWMG